MSVCAVCSVAVVYGRLAPLSMSQMSRGMAPWAGMAVSQSRTASYMGAAYSRVRSVMATGDNAQCADYIARKSGLIDPSARVLLALCEAKDAPPMWRETGVDGAKALSTADVEAMFPDDAAATAASCSTNSDSRRCAAALACMCEK